MTNCLAVLALGAAVPAVTAREPVPAPTPPPPKLATLGRLVYPGSGQDAAPPGQDASECHAWGACLRGRGYGVK